MTTVSHPRTASAGVPFLEGRRIPWLLPREEAEEKPDFKCQSGPEDLRSGCASPVKYNALKIVVALSVELLTLQTITQRLTL